MESERKKILFVIPSFFTGGAERALVRISNFIDRSRYEVMILCLTKAGPNLNAVSADTRVIDIERPSIYFSIFRIYRVIKDVKPDIVFSWMGYINAYLSFFIPLFPSRIKWVCRESSIASLNNVKFRLSWLFTFFYRFYNRYDNVVCQSNAMANDLIKNFNIEEKKITIINNPINFQQVAEDRKKICQNIFPLRHKRDNIELLFVGSLSQVKRPLVLAELVVMLPENYYLTILGNGPLYKELMAKIEANGLGERIRVITDCVNPFPYYEKADCLLLCSSFEGFPNVIVEAFSCGCPAIGFDIKGGANEILDGYGGFIVEGNDIRCLSATVQQVCEKEQIDRDKIAEGCRSKYAIEKIIESYYSVL